MSSIGGVHAFPTLGLYHASKWALEGFTQSLSAEVGDFGIKVTLVEPTGYSTDLSGSSSVQAEHLPVYDDLRAKLAEMYAAMRSPRADRAATGPAILKVVDAEEPPLRIFFGTGPLELIRNEYAQRIATWEQWNDVSQMAQGNQGDEQVRATSHE